jgi:signal transduction histidine kinase
MKSISKTIFNNDGIREELSLFFRIFFWALLLGGTIAGPAAYFQTSQKSQANLTLFVESIRDPIQLGDLNEATRRAKLMSNVFHQECLSARLGEAQILKSLCLSDSLFKFSLPDHVITDGANHPIGMISGWTQDLDLMIQTFLYLLMTSLAMASATTLVSWKSNRGAKNQRSSDLECLQFLLDPNHPMDLTREPQDPQLALLHSSLIKRLRHSKSQILSSQHLQEVDQFLHDLRSPLFTLRVITESVSRGEGCDPELTAETVERVRVLLSRLDRLRSQPSEDSDSTLKKDVVAQISALLRSKEIELSVPQIRLNVEDPEPSSSGLVQADLTDLTRIISNLINNSAESARSLGREPEIEINLKFQKSPQLALIEICDNGAGFSQDLLDTRLVGSLSIGKPDGSALGLRFSKRRVQEWGGHLAIYNRTHQDSRQEMPAGAGITIALPIQSPRLT